MSHLKIQRGGFVGEPTKNGVVQCSFQFPILKLWKTTRKKFRRNELWSNEYFCALVAARECVNLQQSLVPSIADRVSCLYPNIYWILENRFFSAFLGKKRLSKLFPHENAADNDVTARVTADLIFWLIRLVFHAHLSRCNLEFFIWKRTLEAFFCVS